MPKKITAEEARQRIFNLVENEYSLIEFTDASTYAKMKHNICGYEFNVNLSNFLNEKCKCPRCFVTRSITTELFNLKVYDLVGEDFTVLGEYIKSNIKIKFRHNVCNHIFSKTPANFLNGQGCPKCNKKFYHRDTEYFKNEVLQMYNEEYSVLGEYTDMKTHIQMKHNKCNYEYNVSPNNFLNGKKCPKCFGNTKKTTIQFKNEVFAIVGDEYSVLGEYETTHKKILMKHNKCGNEWDLEPNSFLSNGTRCPRCLESKGEKRVREYLECHNILFIPQYMFDDLKYIERLRFDFGIVDNNKKIICLIEYDGIFHYEEIKGKGDKKDLNMKDNMKNEYCIKHNIPLIRIPYWEFDNIESILERELNNILH